MSAKTRDELFLEFAELERESESLNANGARCERDKLAYRLVYMFLADDLDNARDRIAAGERPS